MIYAELFLTEGIGLWLEQRWAEWLTVIITSALIPIEIYCRASDQRRESSHTFSKGLVGRE